MIKFFRKIRQQLLSENKLSKYLIYAIGEIVLVVIGILIALSINNSNEDRKLKTVEINILKGIKQNILMDTIDLNHNTRRHKEMNQRDSILLLHIYDKKPLDSLIEEKLMDLKYSNISLMLHSSYFNEVKSKGLSIISNKTLRDSIARLYEFKYAYLTLIENESKQYDYLSLYEDLIVDYIYLDRELGSFKIGEKHFQSILNDELFLTKLINAYEKRGFLDELYKTTNRSILNILDQIDVELATRR